MDLSLTAVDQVVDLVGLAVDIHLLSSLVVVEWVVEEDTQVVVNSSSFILGEAFRLECFLACGYIFVYLLTKCKNEIDGKNAKKAKQQNICSNNLIQ